MTRTTSSGARRGWGHGRLLDPSDPSRVQLDKGYNDDGRAAVVGLILWAAFPPIFGVVALVKRRREHRDRAV